VQDTFTQGNPAALMEKWAEIDREQQKQQQQTMRGIVNNGGVLDNMRVLASMEKIKEEIISRVHEGVKSMELRVLGRMAHEMKIKEDRIIEEMMIIKGGIISKLDEVIGGIVIVQEEAMKWNEVEPNNGIGSPTKRKREAAREEGEIEEEQDEMSIN
jgi:hypothetical protein